MLLPLAKKLERHEKQFVLSRPNEKNQKKREIKKVKENWMMIATLLLHISLGNFPWSFQEITKNGCLVN